QASAALFGGTLAGLNAADLLAVFTQAPSSELPRAQVVGQPVVDVAVAAGLVSSKSAVRRLIADGGLYLNNERITDAAACVTPAQAIEDRLLVLRQGKRNYRLVRLV
ncbi:MAG: S4 domain-containing protein, partial [bacterium]